ncbi:dihydrodipicolinate reductase C-terminal domain-containing protein [Nocardia sp. NPDC048505]|uniref:dihydrodipicolinate reductase C-terminal domain-containing protein n=1 Tax=unclassified Nocardia TaxID=2637762 RepID=UPI00340795D3
MTLDSIGIVGVTGRLGSAIRQACADSGVPVVATARTTGWRPRTGTPAVLIDASHPSALTGTLEFCRAHRCALLYCVSDPAPADLERLHALGAGAPVALIPNLSPLQWIQTRSAQLAGRLAAALDLTAEITVIDRHTAAKRDAPSATARRLAGVLPESAQVVSERFGVRVCDHRVLFATGGESLELTHAVRDLESAARAALRLAARLAGSAPGFYTADQLYTRMTEPDRGE